MATNYYIEKSDFGNFINFTDSDSGGVITVPNASQIEIEYVGDPTALSLTDNIDENLSNLVMWAVAKILFSIDGKTINNLEDFTLVVQDKYTGEKVKTTFITDQGETIIFSQEPPQITVAEIPKTRIKTGLDLAGGARALVQAKDKELSSGEINDLVSVISNRLNVYGIADMNVLPITDLSGDNYMLIEIAGATPKDLEDLIAQQGKFEAKIANETVFIGGNKDITSVCRNDATCALIESCQPSNDGSYFCNFRFSIYLSEEAAQRHADITSKIEVK